MMDGIVAAIGGVKGAIDIVRGISATTTAADIAEVKLGLLDRLSEAQIALADAREQEQLARERIRTLEAEIVQLKEWDADVASYELADTGRGAMAYRKKDAPAEPKYGHWHCPHCFANRQASLMVPAEYGGFGLLQCHTCKLELHVFGHRPAPQGSR